MATKRKPKDKQLPDAASNSEPFDSVVERLGRDALQAVFEIFLGGSHYPIWFAVVAITEAPKGLGLMVLSDVSPDRLAPAFKAVAEHPHQFIRKPSE
jgi:hypothetical protein